MNVIHEETTTAPTAIATVMDAPVMSSTCTRVCRFKEVDNEEEDSPRRVSFRTNEIEQHKIALLVQSSLEDDDDSEDETDEVLTTNQQPLPTPLEEEKEETCDRGLELKTSRERQTRKFTIIKSIVRNQNQCKPEQLARLAAICNKWASVVAQVQGEMDYQEVYLQSSASLTLPDMASYPMPFKKKRPAGDNDDNQRRVRARSN